MPEAHVKYAYSQQILFSNVFFHLSCFIDHTGVLFGVFLGPIFVVLLFNTVVFVLVVRVLIKHSKRIIMGSKDAKKYKNTFKTLIRIFSIMLMFGLSWLFGAFTINYASILFSWLFVIFNSLQGFLLFLFFCVIGKDAREEWKSVFTCGRSKKKKRLRENMRSKTGQEKSTANTYVRSQQLQAELSTTTYGGFRNMAFTGSGTGQMANTNHTSRNSDNVQNPVFSSANITSSPTIELSADNTSSCIIAEELVMANKLVKADEMCLQVNPVSEENQPEPEPQALPDLQVPPYIHTGVKGPTHPMTEREDSFSDFSLELIKLAQTSAVELREDESTEL